MDSPHIVLRYTNEKDKVHSLAPVAFGLVAAACDSGCVALLDPNSLRVTRVLRGHTGNVLRVCSFSKDRVVSSSS